MTLAGSQRAAGTPDGAEWETAANPEGCLSCHFDSPDPSDSPTLSIEGLPALPSPGDSYPLTLSLSDPALRNAGFMLIVKSGDSPGGRLLAVDDRTETLDQKPVARSTRTGSIPAQAGEIFWRLIWVAPESTGEALRFEVWGNAGNDDQSPLGDTLHHRVWQLPAAAESTDVSR